MSKFVGFIVGTALVVAGIVTGNVALIIQGGAMIASNALALLLAPKGPARTAQEMQIQLGEQPRSAIVGETAVPGSLVDAFNYGGKYGTDWEVLIIRLADHKCDGLTGFYANDEFYPYTADGLVAAINNKLYVYFRGDTNSKALSPVVTANGPGWTAAHNGDSGCDVVVAYKADPPDSKQPEWPGGRPRFLFVVKGLKCYDPRKDSTVPGGSGSHRWNDPSTREWSDNPIVCRYNYARGIYANDLVGNPAGLLVGRGLSEAEAPPENVFAPANLCDELVAGEKRYRVSGPIYANQPFLQVEEMFAAACGGSVITREGSVEIEPGQARSVVAHFTDADVLSASPVKWNHGILSESSEEWINSVVARYVEPAKKWSDHAAPVRRDLADIAADKKPREASITLRLVRWAAQAGRVAEIVRRFGRLWGRAEVVLGPRFCDLEDGDWVNWTSERRFGGATRTFRVEAYQLNEKWHNRLTLRQINATVFGEGAFIPDQSEANPNPQPPPIGAPDSGDWTLTGGSAEGSGGTVPALIVEGAVSDPAAEAVLFEYRLADPGNGPDEGWASAGTESAAVTAKLITGLAAGADYEVAISYRVQGELGDRLILGPVTAGGASMVAQLIASSYPVNLTFTLDSAGLVTLSSHSRKYLDKTVGVTGSSVSSGASAGDLVLVYYDDPERAGGPVGFQALVLAAAAGDASPAFASTDHPYRHFVASKVVPSSGSSDGGSDPGSGGGGGTPPGGGGLVAYQ